MRAYCTVHQKGDGTGVTAHSSGNPKAPDIEIPLGGLMQSLKTDKEKGTAIIVISALGEIPLGKAVKEHTKEDLAQMGITKNDMALSLPDGTDALGNAK